MMKRDLIVESIRRQILSGELPRGTRMPQDGLARQFGASITPVREALRLLEAEGLLVSEPHRGVRVAGVDLDKVKASYVVRRLVESYAMRRAVTRLSPRDIRQAHELLARMEADSSTGDMDSFRRNNRDFHFFFYGRCGMPGLMDQIEAMWQAFPWDLMLSSPERTNESHAEHVAIVEAVEAGDVDATAAATEHHIAQGFAAIAHRLAEDGTVTPDPYDVDVD
jgi:DNA-binding GntR family transcriptional regulator